MKNRLHAYIDSKQPTYFELGDALFNSPELGFKEVNTRQIILDFCQKQGLRIDKQFCLTGLSVKIGSGRPHIGLIAEMDAIPTLNHPCANKSDNAAHACGHSTQMTIMLAAMDALNHNCRDLPGTITLYFTPAEEFTDMNYRRQLISEGKINYGSGKQNMLAQGLFDDEDLLIHLHASSPYHGYRFSVGSTLAGFIYKQITFKGKGAHAAVAPHAGRNALNMCSLFLSALGMLRETFREEDKVRIHGMITKGGDTVNSIPEEVIYECYARSCNFAKLEELSKQVDDTASHCAKALGGETVIRDTPGYLPLKQSRLLNDVLYRNLLNYCPPEEIRTNETSMAAGDVGDISTFKPLIQYGYTGFSGHIHGADLMIADKQEVYITQAKIVADTVYDLLSDPKLVNDITADFKPSMTKEEYLSYLSNKGE